MSGKPSKYFVRIFYVDPEGIDADDQEDFEADTKEVGETLLQAFRIKGMRAALMERESMEPYRHTDGHIISWDFKEKVLKDTHEE